MKYFIIFSYDGSKYNGLQKLKNELTIQGELETILTRLNGKQVNVKCSGRTDKGVHALNQAAHFSLDKPLTPFRLRYYINRMTSDYLYVKSCEVINDENFHSRFSVKEKEYVYKINTGEYDPILNDYVFNYNKKIDLDKVEEVKDLFIGIHNFKAFTVGKHNNYYCEILNINIEKQKNLVIISICGKSFLTHMIRYIVAAILLYQEGTLFSKDIKTMFEKGTRVIEFEKAPAAGLYLKEVKY